MVMECTSVRMSKAQMDFDSSAKLMKYVWGMVATGSKV